MDNEKKVEIYRICLRLIYAIVESLTSLLETKGDFVVKLQNDNMDAKEINFYTAKNVSFVPSVQLNENGKITEAEMRDIKSKRIAVIVVNVIYTTFKHLQNGESRANDAINKILVIKTKTDVRDVIDIFWKAYYELFNLYKEAMLASIKQNAS